MSLDRLIIIAGPTAVGKTDISVKLAKKIGGEIISADSMQVYRGMDIGTAKVSREEMDGVPHHLIDILDPSEDFNVSVFKEKADKAISDITGRGKIPIIVGGTGFYIQAVLYGIDFSEGETDSEYVKILEKEASEKGPDYLFEMLMEIDPESCRIIHKNNIKRVIRALEFYHCTGQKISEHNSIEHEKKSRFDYDFFVITDDRELLYQRIDERVDRMMDAGLLEEVRTLGKMKLNPESTSMQGIGYKQLIPVLLGKDTLEHAIYLIKRDSRHYAKRQLTWFRREKDVKWIDRQDFKDNDRIADYIAEIVIRK